MTSTTPIEQRHQTCLDILTSRGQEHLLRWWDELGSDQRNQLLADIESIPWELVDGLVATHVLSKPPCEAPTNISPPDVYPHHPGAERTSLYRKAMALGESMIRDGKVAAFTVAGGQGTRLGHDGPKGTLVVTPVGNRTLFQLFAETILAVGRRYDTEIPWYIMTSAANHAQTVEYFESHGFLGLPREDVFFFKQGMLPLFGFDGRILLSDKHRVSLGPDGHGGSLKAMVACGALDDMRKRGVEIVSYFQVDNPLVKPIDPLFIGLHAETESEASTKVTPKADDLERVGNVCVRDGKIQVIEYSDFPEKLAHRRNADGGRTFDAANLAIHLFNVDFIQRIVGKTNSEFRIQNPEFSDPAGKPTDTVGLPGASVGESFRLPFRRAGKAVPCIDETGAPQRPSEPNAVKLEMFVFDALPLADNPLVFEVDRSEEFSPVKNATGTDSLETSQRDQNVRACKWLTSAGVDVPRNADGTPDITVAISPIFALDVAAVRTKKESIPELRAGDSVYLVLRHN